MTNSTQIGAEVTIDTKIETGAETNIATEPGQSLVLNKDIWKQINDDVQYVEHLIPEDKWSDVSAVKSFIKQSKSLRDSVESASKTHNIIQDGNKRRRYSMGQYSRD